MRITCPHCQKQYRLDLAKIRPTVKKVRCKACGATFSLPGESAPRQAEIQAEPILAAPASRRGPRRFALSFNKVGMGKTTTAVTLAAGLATAGFKTLLVDADPQGRAASYLGVSPKGGLAELISGDLTPEAALVKARENLWLLAGGNTLAGLRHFADDKASGSVPIIDETIAPIEKEFAFVLVDTSPEWNPLTISVLFYVRELLIPVSMEVMSVQGFGEFLPLLEPVGRLVEGRWLKYILPTFYDPRVRKSIDIYEKFMSIYGDLVCAPIHYSGQLQENQAQGKTVFDLGVRSRSREDYEELARKVAHDPTLFT
jgi:chromosome partitioning protein